jgi:hypothetical protein
VCNKFGAERLPSGGFDCLGCLKNKKERSAAMAILK